jgi:hypothetical protein
MYDFPKKVVIADAFIHEQHPTMIAAEVRNGDAVPRLRSHNGRPVWAG